MAAFGPLRATGMAFNFKQCIDEHHDAVERVRGLEPKIRAVVELLKETFARGGRVYVCGNGGSAADAQHFASELTGRYERDRRPYPAIALTTDCSALTAVSNDYGFEHVFARQLDALAKPGDVLIAISTSGNSPNIVRALENARAHGLHTVGLLGRNGGAAAKHVEHALIVDAPRTSRIQEAHILILHLLCEPFEE
jgi:D-sedoheptulose 7-phosphate isomerase